MKRHVIFVDAGYVFAQGAVSLVGKKISRTELKLDQDGAGNGLTSEHLAIANMSDVKLKSMD